MFPKISMIMALILPILLVACGPVKFSSESSSGDNTPTVVDPTGTLRDVHYNNTIQSTSQMLDIVLVIDDSNSMLSDNRKLAARLAPFVNKLKSSVNWQMCATTTRALLVNGTYRWGASIYWQNYSAPAGTPGYILKPTTTSDLATVFNSTIDYINAGWANSDDERAIKAAYNHVYNGDYRYSSSGCYRSGAAIAYIIISDEDERSIGGDLTQRYYASEGLALEEEDKPQVFVDYVKSTFGANQRFTVNSIIVKPGDTACMNQQDAEGSKSHFGTKYAELSNLTGGGIGSICATDFATNLNLFYQQINNSLSSVPLECAPHNGNISVTITPSAGAITSRVEGTSLVFSSPVQAGYTIDLKYQCMETRTPSSTGDGATAYEAPGFFARIVNFFKSLF